MPMRLLHSCIADNHLYAWYPQRPEEKCPFPEVTGGSRMPCECWELSWVPWKSSQCSYHLRYLSSHLIFILIRNPGVECANYT